MAARKKKPLAPDDVATKLVDGHYDRALADFEAVIAEAAALLRRVHEAMKAENTLRS